MKKCDFVVLQFICHGSSSALSTLEHRVLFCDTDLENWINYSVTAFEVNNTPKVLDCPHFKSLMCLFLLMIIFCILDILFDNSITPLRLPH